MPTKQQVIDTLRGQDWILTEAQKPKFRDFLRDYTVEPEDIPFLKKIARLNRIDIDKFKDTALFEKIKNDVNTKVDDAAAVLDKEDLLEIKKDRFEKLRGALPRTFTLPQGQIEVVDLENHPQGITVFARAWRKNGDQIGFGDGTVDIERFNIINPPVLVEDEAGDIEIPRQKPDGTVRIRKARENLRDALLQSLVETIKVMKNIHGPENIIPNKRGNTTSTFYAAEDGMTQVFSGTSWDDARDDGGGGVDNTDEIFPATLITGGGAYRIYRGAFKFDTSSIGSDTISSATFSAYYVNDKIINDNDSSAFVSVTHPNPAGASLVAGDYDSYDGLFGAMTEGVDTGNRIDMSTFTGTQYYDWSLNSTGIGWVDGSGSTWLGLNLGHDIVDHPLSGGSGTFNDTHFEGNEAAGTTQDAKLVVEHSAGGGGGATNNAMAFGGGV